MSSGRADLDPSPAPPSSASVSATDSDPRLIEAPVGLGVATLAGTLVAANDALARLLGLPGREVAVGASLASFHAFPELAADMIGERLEGAAPARLELDIRRADGTEAAVSVDLSPPRVDPDGRTLVAFAARDVTSERGDRETSSQGLKMEAVVRFAGGVAHDYNNLLTSILGETRALIEESDPDDPSHAGLSQILVSARRAAEITRRLLTFSRSELSRQETVDLNGTLRHLQATLEGRIGGETTLILRTDPDLDPVRIDPAHLEETILALVDNARDATPAGGRIVIETGRVVAPADTQGLDFAPPVPPGIYASLAVGDTGIGMNAETRRRVFDPFFTTKPMGGGVGLGLTTVYGHALRAHGHVGILSAPAHGTLVRVLFPPEGAARRVSVAPKIDRATPDGRPRRLVVVVDDEPPVLRVMSKILARAGFEVMQAPDGMAARNLLDRLDQAPDILVTDVMMPRLKGTELASWMQTRWPGTPTLLVSGYTDDEAVGAWADADPASFLTKPFEPQELLDRVEQRLASV